jgi:hypothetical protein
MYESRNPPFLQQRFIRHQVRHVLIAGTIIFGSLALGTLGYRRTEGLPWLDAVENAAMILTGMGPVDRVETRAGKIFATCYALFSGVAFLTSVGVLLAPVMHRFFHRFHLELEEQPERTGSPRGKS